MIKVGLFGIGLDTYWNQFDGLLDNLKGYQEQIRKKIESCGVEVVDAGMVENPVKASEAAAFLHLSDVEIVFLYVSTYALSSTVLPIARKVKVPLIILNLQPVPQLDIKAFNAVKDRGEMTGIWLEHCQTCAVPEITSVLNRSGIKYDLVTGYLEDETAWSDIAAWTEAARVGMEMRNNRMGVLGQYYGGMLDVYTDLTRQSSTFGTHFEMIEMCELKRYRDEATGAEVKKKVHEFHETFDVGPECDEQEIERAARTSVALDKLVDKRMLGSIAYYYEGEPGNEYENIVTSVIAEGESVPGPVLEIGNTNSRYRFCIGAREFINRWSVQGPSHHCAIGVGHIADKIEKLGKVLNLDAVRIC